MAVPPIPAPHEQLTHRPFSFYPPILNIDHNEWRYRGATWSEIQVVNTKSGLELWIPRRFLGQVSRIDEPVLILGLLKELEYRAGAVWPTQRRVLEMPRPPLGAPPAGEANAAGGPAQVVGISLEPGTERRIGSLVGLALVAALTGTVLVISFTRGSVLRQRVVYTARDTDYLTLTRDDDYYSVIRKLGRPVEDRWRSETGELQYRVLTYPARSYSIILMGSDRNDARVIGVMDRDWRPIHYVSTPDGGTTAPMLRRLPKF